MRNAKVIPLKTIEKRAKMDCCICTSMPAILRPPRNTICGSCYEGAKTIITLMNKYDSDKGISDEKSSDSFANLCKASSIFIASSTLFFPQPLASVPNWMNSMKEREDELNEKINFLSGFIALFRQEMFTDIQLIPGNGGPSISAHTALLASRSEIFKNMLDSDSCKAPANDTITLSDLNHEELETLLEFLYSGTIPIEKLKKNVYSLTLAADKYEIPFLLKFCERYMLRSLDISNALDVLEISDICSNNILKESALNFIVKNLEDIVYSAKYEGFVSKNPHLAVHITRSFLMDAKSRKRNENYIA
ncbi:BTB/POZ domain-containing protein At3g56230 [Mercurialis annua]|uniref:BTB/POZ domain-containing protein At3g56230 n=1 Tax=Mercurialis annua TaxID=3986 RepID=UPI0021606286|nr:BTB/POZ domain-containing protein At3g56230 [Mercurialis annua]